MFCFREPATVRAKIRTRGEDHLLGPGDDLDVVPLHRVAAGRFIKRVSGSVVLILARERVRRRRGALAPSEPASVLHFPGGVPLEIRYAGGLLSAWGRDSNIGSQARIRESRPSRWPVGRSFAWRSHVAIIQYVRRLR